MDAISGMVDGGTPVRNRRRRPSLRYRLTGRFWLLIMLLLLVYAAGQFTYQAWKVREYRQRIAEAEQELERVMAENAAMREQLRYADTDAFIEERAREQGYVYPHETAVVLAAPSSGDDVERRPGVTPTPGY